MLYYFVLLSLPPLSFREKPEISFAELKDRLYLNLSLRDRNKFAALMQPIDLYNVRAFWLGQPLDDRGNVKAKELEEALLVGDNLPLYLSEYLERYETVAQRLRHFSFLVASLYREKIEEERGFLRRYFQFERELMLVLAAFRSKRTGVDIVKDLQFEDLSDPIVAYILSQRDADAFTPPKEFEGLTILFENHWGSPEKLNRSILEYRLDRIEEIEQEDAPFSIDQVLSYVAKFLIIDGWFRLDQIKGNLAVEGLSHYG